MCLAWFFATVFYALILINTNWEEVRMVEKVEKEADEEARKG